MAEPRKRAPRKPASPPAERTRASGGAPEPEREWTLGGEAPGATPSGLARLELPASGLAEDILARPDAALVAPATAPLAARDEPGADPAAAPAHSLSFFAAPAREEKKAVEASEHLATFLLAGEEYGVDVRVVQEIIRVGEITQVPRAPDFIKGVINLRGRIIPVVDLKRKLSLGVVELTREARIVVVKLKERLIGLLVDGASQVLKVPVAVIEAAPEEVVEIDTNAVRGVAKLEKRLIILIDLLRILAPELRDAGPSA
jgi:purine-binding chemotaxis protein CheW